MGSTITWDWGNVKKKGNLPEVSKTLLFMKIYAKIGEALSIERDEKGENEQVWV